MNVKGKNKKIVLDAMQIAEVQALAAYLPIEAVAQYLGISEVTFYEIKKRQPEVLEAYSKGRAKAHIAAAEVVLGFLKMKENTSTKLAAAQFYLTHQAGWTKTQLIETKDITPEKPRQIIIAVNEKPSHRKDDC